MSGTNFDFKKTGIGDLLRSGRLVVPANQRSYAWEDRHVDDLFQDLNEAIINDEDDYFLGTIVLIQAKSETPSIVDGQQRLATSSILLARIRDHLATINRVTAARSIDNDYLRNTDIQTEEIKPRLTLNVEDNEFFAKCILPARFDEDWVPVKFDKAILSPSNRRLLRASEIADEFIKSRLSGLRPEAHHDHLVRWVNFIKEKALIIAVTVPDEIGAFRMFETLNDRGLRASQADILKNYLFSKSGSRLVEAQKYWNAFSGAIETSSEEDDLLITYIRHLWITKHGPTKERELAGRIKTEITGETKTMEFLLDASSAVEDYIALWNPTYAKWRGYKTSTKQYVHTIVQHLKVKQIRPLLFAVSHYFDPSEADNAFRLLVAWSVRFLIVGGRGGMLDTQYSLRAHEIGVGKIRTARDLSRSMKEYIPSDKEFEEAFATARVSRPYLARYYLRAIDKTNKNDPAPEYVANEDETEINLEHILPRQPGADWKIELEDAMAIEKMLGNMVLLQAKSNVYLGNSSFDDKKKAYKKSSYTVTSDVAGYNNWTAKEVQDRQRKMAKIAVKTWPLKIGK